MTFLTFEYLLQELTPFIYSSVTQFDKTPILLRKAVKMVLYQLAHGISLEKMNALYGVGVYIVCDVLFNGDRLILVYVHTFTKDQLFHIIE
jgi:Ni/Fe-hydrogenase subunit HybB-like protein